MFAPHVRGAILFAVAVFQTHRVIRQRSSKEAMLDQRQNIPFAPYIGDAIERFAQGQAGPGLPDTIDAHLVTVSRKAFGLLDHAVVGIADIGHDHGDTFAGRGIRHQINVVKDTRRPSVAITLNKNLRN